IFLQIMQLYHVFQAVRISLLVIQLQDNASQVALLIGLEIIHQKLVLEFALLLLVNMLMIVPIYV
ncbi:MAG: hypothetical protein ACKO96_19505, partial [Flammeovirgaceae bacterium]